ncbi:MAG: hypothetical protein GY940_45825, partial [bacterium]|nr:hypothetical protein [bacterium]
MLKQRHTNSIKQLLAAIVLVQLSLSWCQLWGLDPGKRIDRYLVDQWQTAQGLQSNKILAIARTDDGYLWFRTDKGLIRFDGVTF